MILRFFFFPRDFKTFPDGKGTRLYQRYQLSFPLNDWMHVSYPVISCLSLSLVIQRLVDMELLYIYPYEPTYKDIRIYRSILCRGFTDIANMELA